MDQNVEDFHIILPSNASMNYFPQNTPDSYRTKLAQPITLNNAWECCLTEATIPGRFFTIHSGYNDDYYIEKEVLIENETTLPEIIIPLHNNDYEDFVEGLNANIRKSCESPIFSNKILILPRQP